MPRTCEACGGARRVRRAVKRKWWEAILQRPSVVDELCGSCGGIGVIRGTPEEEEVFERQRQARHKEQERQAAAERTRRQEELERREATAARRPSVPPQQTSAEQESWMIGDVRVVFALTSSAVSAFRQRGFTPIDCATAGLAQASGAPAQVLKQPDGKFRLQPGRRNQVESMRVYSDAKGSVIVTDKALDQPAPTYTLEGRLDLMLYVSSLCQKLGIAPGSFLKP
jgi:hypothetical protein